MAGFSKAGTVKERGRERRKRRIRQRVFGTAERPRLSVFRSLNHIYVQAIDDTSGKVVASCNDADKTVGATGKKRERAKAVGKAIAARLKDKQVGAVVFDRNGYIYHGRVKEVAEGAREGGLKF